VAHVGELELGASAGVADILGFVWRTLRANVGALYGPGFVSYVVTALCYLALQTRPGTYGVSAWALASCVVGPLASVALLGGRLRMTLMLVRGKEPTVDDFYRGIGRAFPLLTIAALIAAVLLVIALFAGVIAALVMRATVPPGALLAADETTYAVLYPTLAAFCVAFGLLLAPAAYVTVPLSLSLVPAADGVRVLEALRHGFAASRGHRVAVGSAQLIAAVLMVPLALTFCIGAPVAFALGDLVLTTAYLAYAPRGRTKGHPRQRWS
jgi:hypothetical protein